MPAVVADEPAAGGPVLPAYGGPCIGSLVPALLRQPGEPVPPWLPAELADARQVVLLVLDGIGWHNLHDRAAAAPTLLSGVGRAITSVAPTTTATALSSIALGLTPAEHGVVGYRIRLGPDTGTPPVDSEQVMNVLRWRSERGDLRRLVRAEAFQPRPAFRGRQAQAVTRAEFASTGFTAAHLGGARLVGWAVPSTMVVETRRLLAAGEPFVYAYYDGLDKVAHQYGLGEHYVAELVAVDRLVADLVAALPPGAALVITSDHGQVEVGANTRLPGPELLAATALLSGEGRFRWLHARPGAAADLLDVAEALHGSEAWVRSREQIVDEGWFGGPLPSALAARLGDVALVAHQPVAFLDPADTGETRLASRHGSLTAVEMLVPVLVWPAS